MSKRVTDKDIRDYALADNLLSGVPLEERGLHPLQMGVLNNVIHRPQVDEAPVSEVAMRSPGRLSRAASWAAKIIKSNVERPL